MLVRVSLPGDSNSIKKILNDFIPNYNIVWNEILTQFGEANFPFVNGRCHLKRSMPFITVDYTLHFKEN